MGHPLQARLDARVMHCMRFKSAHLYFKAFIRNHLSSGVCGRTNSCTVTRRASLQSSYLQISSASPYHHSIVSLHQSCRSFPVADVLVRRAFKTQNYIMGQHFVDDEESSCRPDSPRPDRGVMAWSPLRFYPHASARRKKCRATGTSPLSRRSVVMGLASCLSARHPRDLLASMRVLAMLANSHAPHGRENL